jgi:uncharacterized protein (TIGR00369 family)
MKNRADPPEPERTGGDPMGEFNGQEGTVFDRLGDRPQVAALMDWTLVRLDAGSDSILLSFTASERFTNPAGSVHGGFIAAMLDECMGSAIVGLTDAQFLPATVSMSTDFIKPVLVGKVFGEGRITSRSNSFAFLEAKLSDGDGQILARATGTYRLRPFPDAVKNQPGPS